MISSTDICTAATMNVSEIKLDRHCSDFKLNVSCAGVASALRTIWGGSFVQVFFVETMLYSNRVRAIIRVFHSFG